ncbi:serine/threonine-protein kinase [Streptomyces sp. NPDC091268]|uniref:serine/threonine-protein kinase n=1 Tax=Streptomyces sp. NPDC091268 TaxID=3365979 RepID=UPI0037F9DBA0
MTARSVPEHGAPPERHALLGGRYRIEGTIGSGGTADVFRGVDLVLGREVAVKVFREGTDTVTADRFCDEARMLARLSHPALVTVYDAGRHDRGAFMVTELIRGVTLRTRMDAGPLGPVQVMRIGADISSALDHVHAHGVIHHDVKPSNILLGEEGSPHLADFGLSRTVHERSHSAPDTLVGTLAYMAPEQFLGEGASPASDVYALGVTLLEALTGRREYQGTPVEIGTAHLLRAPRIPEGLQRDLARLLKAMTDQDPKARPDAAAVHQRLQDIARAPRPRRAASAALDGAALDDTSTHRTTHRSFFVPHAVHAAHVPGSGRKATVRRGRAVGWGLVAASVAGTCALLVGGIPADEKPPATAPAHEQPPTSNSAEAAGPGPRPSSSPPPPPAPAPSTAPETQAPADADGSSSTRTVPQRPAKTKEVPGKAKGKKDKGR